MKSIFTRLRLVASALAALWLLGSCADSGSEPPPQPQIISVIPASAPVGDTVRLSGSGFGSVRGTSGVTVGGAAATAYVSWSGTEIRFVIPVGASSGSIRVTVGGVVSNAVPFTVTGGGGGSVSFTNDVQPILTMGCALSGCHSPPSPTSGFDQSTYAGVRAGGQKFGTQVVVAGDSSSSRIIQAMRGTAPGLGRMPFGGPWVSTGVPDSLIHTIAVWIQEGAANN